MIPISYNLRLEKDAITITPENQEYGSIVIDRLTEEVKYQNNTSALTGNIQKICGVWGLIKLISGHFLIVIKQIKSLGKLNNMDIYQIKESQIIPVTRSNRHITDNQIRIEKEYLQMIDSVLQQPGFYFSPNGDLTHTFQRVHDTSSDFYQSSLFERAEERFVWNRNMLINLTTSSELQKFALPIMHGYVGVINNRLSRDSGPFQLWLISRRSVHRAGTRYYSRGSDSSGNVSNFVETEQILVQDNQILSFVQTRGSIPLIWSQKPNIYYKPDPLLTLPEQDQARILTEHFNSQIYLHKYGKQIVVNLLNQSGSEKPLGSSFARAISNANIDKVKFVPFDFHHMCRKMRWDRLSILINSLEPDMKELGYTTITNINSSSNAQMTTKQNGVFRTNCIDCLDRTNVVQSLIAWCTLEAQFFNMNQLTVSSSIEGADLGVTLSQMEPHLHFQYKNLWADNGDALASQYTGTGALKSDFTRTGKRSSAGLLHDGYKSAIRYILNNFRDGFRQDSIDLFLGNYIVDSLEGSSQNRMSPLQNPRTVKYRVIPWTFVFTLSLMIMRICFPTEEWASHLFQLFVLFIILVLCLSIVFSNGYEFVDSPKLKKDD